ncbi:MAG: bifunctional isocitrate dehydrogenase kinase/phosphatase [Deltaproteobacteria bacterium]|nr:bifunctional isocitrate dehydrogenase kinase/phosphatase [Deltaproteobacteria bacterium]
MVATIARAILKGFNRHYRIFRAVAVAAKERFERGAWAEVIVAHRDRIPMYARRVDEAVALLERRLPASGDDSLWPEIKHAYMGLLYEHLQPECAETFYNSVATRVLRRRYFHNRFIFFRPAISTEHLQGTERAYRCYYPTRATLQRVLRKIVLDYGIKGRFHDLERDLKRVVAAFVERYTEPSARNDYTLHANFQIQTLGSLFYRNRAGYLVGRVLNGNREIPFVVPILKNDAGALYLDTLLLEPAHIAGVFSLARSYFMVDMEVPAAYVTFLQALMPRKPKAELYTLLGLQKQGKTLFYRDFQHHLSNSSDSFVIAPGVRGMVMLVFTLPSFPYVFKIIRDHFDAPKDTTREAVLEKYLWVKQHDRVGRMADTLEYSDVAFPRTRFSPALIAEMKRLAPSSFKIVGDQLVVKHLYLERRMAPLDLHLVDLDPAKKRLIIRQYGFCLRELAIANIFPGDLLIKNFGVTRYGRVVCYDYDEMGPLTDFNFRRLPPTTHTDDEMKAEPWFSVGPQDLFPEEFVTFMFHDDAERQMFREEHPDLLTPDFWQQQQERIRAGHVAEFFSYPARVRFGFGRS